MGFCPKFAMRIFMKRSLVVTLFSLFALLTSGYAIEKFDAAHSVALDAVIENGHIQTSGTNTYSVKQEITQQLMYAIGHMNSFGGSPDMQKIQVTITSIVANTNGIGFTANYQARLFLAWPNEFAVPLTWDFIVPARGDYQGLNSFFELYGSDEQGGKRCLANEAHDVTSGIFWYYYRPEQDNCPLWRGVPEATRLTARLSQSPRQTSNKSPEYGKVWEDGTLAITAIFGKAEDGSTSSWDAGVKAYVDTVNALIARFGAPSYSNVPLVGGLFRAGITNPETYLVFNTQKGKVDVALFLVNDIKAASPSFYTQYNQRTLISDFISYSGHSGLGANIRTLAGMGTFRPGQYQLFLVNGCDTFAYVDEALALAHQRINPTFGKDKFLDLITNAMPSYFHMNQRSNMAVINAFYEMNKTYKQILSGFDKYQRAVVTGEEDNRWPAAFLP
jgi:hypothetical protein